MYLNQVSFEQLKKEDREEYFYFLMTAYQDQINRERYVNRKMVQKFWQWEYTENPNQESIDPLIYIARYEKRIIAQISVMPISLKLDNWLYKGGWIQDFIVDSQFRDQGIGKSLVFYMLKKLPPAIHIALVLGTNQKSYTLFKYCGFNHVGKIKKNVKLLDAQSISRQISSYKILQSCLTPLLKILFSKQAIVVKESLNIMELKQMTSEFDVLWDQVSQNFSCITKRDTSFLQWRFFDQPHSNYKILKAMSKGCMRGYIILKESRLKTTCLKGLKIGVISEIFFAPDDSMAGISLLHAAIAYFKEKVSLIRCDILSASIQPLLQQLGFINLKSNFRFLVYPLAKDTKNRMRLIIDKKKWHLTFSDSDLDFS